MKQLTDEFQQALFVSRQVRNIISRDLKAIQNSDPKEESHHEIFQSSDSITSSLDSRYKLSNAQYSTTNNNTTESSESLHVPKADSQVFTDENVGICALIEMINYSELIESLHGKVPPHVITRSMEGILSKMIDIINEYNGDIIKISYDTIVIVWRTKLKDNVFRDATQSQSKVRTYGLSQSQNKYSYNQSKTAAANKDESIPSNTDNKSHSALLALNAVLCCEKCLTTVGQMQVWALEDYIPSYAGLKLPLRCSISTGSLIDIHFGLYYVKSFALCLGTAVIRAKRLLTDDIAPGTLIVSSLLWNNIKTLGNIIATKNGEGYIVKPIPRATEDPIYVLISMAYSHILYNENSTLDSIKTTNLLETFICDDAVSLFRLKKDNALTQESLKGKWEKCSVIAIRVGKVYSGDDFADKNQSLIEVCRRGQEILTYILKNAWPNNISYYKTHVTLDGSITFTLVCYDSETVNSANSAIKFGIIFNQIMSRKILFKEVSVGISSGDVFKGVLINQNRSDFRVLGECIKRAFFIATNPNCKRKVLFDQYTDDKYVNDFKSEMFRKIDIVLPNNGLFPKKQPTKHFEMIFLYNGKIETGIVKEIEEKRDIKYSFKSFLEKREPKTILLEGDPGSGKTRNIRHLKSCAVKSGLTLISTACCENDVFSTPLYPYTIITSRLIDLCDTSSNLNKKNNIYEQSIDNFKDFKNRTRKISMLKKSGIVNDVHKPKTRAQLIEKSPSSVFGSIPDFLSKALKRSNNKKVTSPLSSFKENDPEKNLISSVKETLDRIGEDSSKIMPLLNSVLLPDTDLAREMDDSKPESKTRLLCSFLIRMINRISLERPLAIFIDDVQWMDSASWTMTLQIIRKCPNAMLIMSSTVIKDYRSVFINQLKGIPKTLIVDLDDKNLNFFDKIIVGEFFMFGNSINPDLENMIRTNYGDCYMAIEAFSRVMLDFNLYSIKDGCVSFQPKKDFETPSSFKEVIKLQYNRLESKAFQKLLRCASVIGRVFSIEEVCAIWSDIFPSQQRSQNQLALTQFIMGTLLANDYFDFFEPLSLDDDAITPNIDRKHIFAFRHSVVRLIIYYEITSEAERNIRHKNLISHYERQLNTITEPVYIPLLSHHYSKSITLDRTTILKRIKYLIMLGIYLCKSAESYMESRMVLIEVNRLLDLFSMQDQFESSLSVGWYLNSAVSLSHGPEDFREMTQAFENVKAGLKILEHRWPESNLQWWTHTTYYQIILSFRSIWWASLPSFDSKLFVKSTPDLKGSIQDISELPHKNHVIYHSSREPERLKHFELFMTLVAEQLQHNQAPLRELILCDMIRLNLIFKMKRDVKRNSLKFIFNIATLYWFMGKIKFSINLFRRALSELLDSSGRIRSDLPADALVSSVVYLTICGKWDWVEKQTAECLASCFKIGYYEGWARCSDRNVFICTFSGSFKQALEYVRAHQLEASCNGKLNHVRITKNVEKIILLFQGEVKNIDFKIDQGSGKIPDNLLCALNCLILSHAHFNENKNVACLQSLDKMIEYMEKIQLLNGHVLLGIFSALLLICKIEEIECAKENETERPSFGDWNDSQGSLPDKEYLSLKFRTIKKLSKRVSPSNDVEESGISMKTILNGIIKVLITFSSYSASPPLMVLARVLLRYKEAGYHPSNATILLEEARKISADQTPYMKYVGIVLGAKAWRFDPGSADGKEGKAIAEKIADKRDIPYSLKVL